MAKSQINSREKRDQSSGKITIEGSKVIWHNTDVVFAVVDLNEVVVIGEYTNSDGPWFDDWFIVLVSRDGNWRSLPWYADNIDELAKILSDKFQADFNVSFLTSSTKWRSIVRHPARLEGKPLFVLVPGANYKEPKTFLDMLLAGLGFGKFDTTKEIRLTDEVKHELF